MRLGWEYYDEWRQVLPLLNAVPLTRIILHPRIGRQQYKGMVYKKELRLFAEMCQHPLVYNGDLHTPDDIRRIEEEYPDLDGVMIGARFVSQSCACHGISGRHCSSA